MHSKSHHPGAARLFSFENIKPLAQASRLKEIERDKAAERYQVELQLLKIGYMYVGKAHEVLLWVDRRYDLVARNNVGYNETVLTVSCCLGMFGEHLEDRHAYILKVIVRLEEILRKRLEERDTVRSRIPDWKNNTNPKNIHAAVRLTLKEQIAEAQASIREAFTSCEF